MLAGELIRLPKKVVQYRRAFDIGALSTQLPARTQNKIEYTVKCKYVLQILTTEYKEETQSTLRKAVK